MPYNSDHNVAFIHIPKNAGKSIENAIGITTMQDQKKKHQTKNLVSRLLFKAGKMFDRPQLRRKGFGTGFLRVNLQHLTFIQMNHALDIPEDATWFAVIRNPYTRVVSLYNHHVRKSKKGKFIESFSEFLERFLDGQNLPTSHDSLAHRRLQVHFLEGPNGKIDPNIYLLRFEKLQNDFNSFCSRLKLKSKLKWHEKQVGSIYGKSIPFRNWTRKDLDLVNAYYKRDFNELHYEKMSLQELHELDP